VSAALCLAAASPNLVCLIAASMAIGLTSVVPHLILPFAAQLAAPEQHGKAVGMVLSGLLIGILLARTVSGYVGALFGWRAMYVLAACIAIGLAAALRSLLPESVPTVDISYRKTLLSLLQLIREQPVLRQAAAIGAMTFGAFSAFWTTLVFLLEGKPYAYHSASSVAGLFGLVGVVGAGAAPLMGRIADRRGPRATLGTGLLILLVSYLVFWRFGYQLWGLVIGVILMDFGVQAAHVSNQTRIYALLPAARSRLNTVYMVTYFLGGIARVLACRLRLECRPLDGRVTCRMRAIRRRLCSSTSFAAGFEQCRSNAEVTRSHCRIGDPLGKAGDMRYAVTERFCRLL